MKKSLLALALSATLAGCTSIESATINSSEIVSAGGEPIAVIQASTMGFTLFLHFVTIVNGDLDTCITKVLVAEAKALGASKVDLRDVSTSPTHGVWSLMGLLVGFPASTVSGIAVK